MAKEISIKQYWSLSIACSMIAVYFVYVALAFGINLGFMSKETASAGLLEMSGTFASFSPVYGVVLAFFVIILFVGLSTFFASMTVR